MPHRMITCVRCGTEKAYQNYKRHLLSCNGAGRFCPICCAHIELEGLALTDHLLNCQRKMLVFVELCKNQLILSSLVSLI